MSLPRGAGDPPSRYQPFYCEENVYHLAQETRFAGRDPHAVFISGPLGACVMWSQKAAPQPGAPLLWDYHVVLLVADPWEVWDHDTTLGLPVAAEVYLRESFREGLPEALGPLFRLVRADELARVLVSDRSHMRLAGGRWRKPPPPWPTIGEVGEVSNLKRFIDMGEAFVGERCDLAALKRRVG